MHSEQCTVQSKNKAQNVLNWTRQIVVGVQRGEKPLVRNACHSKTGGSHVITIHLHVCNSILSGSDFSAETKQTDSNTFTPKGLQKYEKKSQNIQYNWERHF